MPQTSPMIWLMMSSSIPIMLTSLFPYFMFNNQNLKNSFNNKFNINKKNFNWMW